LGAGGAGVQSVCGRCLSSSSSLSCPAGSVSSSFSTESLALVHGLEWCHSPRASAKNFSGGGTNGKEDGKIAKKTEK